MGKVNLRPDSFAEGGGLADDFDGVITDVRFIMTDYNGKSQEAVPVADVKFDIDGEEASQMYSVGGKNDFVPDETGMGLDPLKGKSTLTKRSNFGAFLESLIAAGFPLKNMESDNISYLNGLEGHFLRKASDAKGSKQNTNRDGEAYTVLVCTKLITLPGNGKKAGTKKGTKKAAAAAASDEVAEALTGIIQGLLLDGELPKKDMLTALFKNDDIKAMGDDKKVALKLAADDTFLAGRGEWVYADGKLTLA